VGSLVRDWLTGVWFVGVVGCCSSSSGTAYCSSKNGEENGKVGPAVVWFVGVVGCCSSSSGTAYCSSGLGGTGSVGPVVGGIVGGISSVGGVVGGTAVVAFVAVADPSAVSGFTSMFPLVILPVRFTPCCANIVSAVSKDRSASFITSCLVSFRISSL